MIRRKRQSAVWIVNIALRRDDGKCSKRTHYEWNTCHCAL